MIPDISSAVHSLRPAHRLGSWVRSTRPGRRDGETGYVSGVMVRLDGIAYGVTWWDCSESWHRPAELTAAWPSTDPTDQPTD